MSTLTARKTGAYHVIRKGVETRALWVEHENRWHLLNDKTIYQDGDFESIDEELIQYEPYVISTQLEDVVIAYHANKLADLTPKKISEGLVLVEKELKKVPFGSDDFFDWIGVQVALLDAQKEIVDFLRSAY